MHCSQDLAKGNGRCKPIMSKRETRLLWGNILPYLRKVAASQRITESRGDENFGLTTRDHWVITTYKCQQEIDIWASRINSHFGADTTISCRDESRSEAKPSQEEIGPMDSVVARMLVAEQTTWSQAPRSCLCFYRALDRCRKEVQPWTWWADRTPRNLHYHLPHGPGSKGMREITTERYSLCLGHVAADGNVQPPPLR